MPSPSVSTFCCASESPQSFVHRLFISDADQIKYKLEASGDWPPGERPPGGLLSLDGGGPPRESAAWPGAPAELCCRGCGEEKTDRSSGVPTAHKHIRRVPPTQILVFVSYPYCSEVWDAGASGEGLGFRV